MAKVNNDEPLVYVGIGASAGGLAALKRLLPRLPVGRQFTYVLMQHMDPTHPSALDQILKNTTDLSIDVATDGVQLKAGHLYISPSNKDCRVVDGHLHLDDVHTVGPRHSVDVLLASIAAAHGKSAAGIILSGTGADGLLGAHEIKAAQGLVLVQDPDDAEHSGMPKAVVEARLADIIAPARSLGDRLAEVVEKAGQLQMSNPELHGSDVHSALSDLLLRKTGFAFNEYKDSTLNRRIARRIAINDLATLDEYFDLVKTSETEAGALAKPVNAWITQSYRLRIRTHSCTQNFVLNSVKGAKSRVALRIFVKPNVAAQRALNRQSGSVSVVNRRCQQWIFRARACVRFWMRCPIRC